MTHAHIFLSSLSLALLLGGSAVQAAAGDGESQLVEDLRQLAQQSRQRNAADRWLQRALDDLVARYDNPWQRSILFEDFGDGDFTHNPQWQVLSGNFQVIRGQGLSSSFGAYPHVEEETPPDPVEARRTPEEEFGRMMFGALLGQAMGPQNGGQASDPAVQHDARETGPNRIRVQAHVSNAFSMITTLRTDGRDGTLFELSLLQSEQGRYGYRLRVDSGSNGVIELERIRKGHGAIIESQPLEVALDDGHFHDITWQQAPDGTVEVLIDDTRIFAVRDRAFRDGYPWLMLDHQSGDLTLRSVRIDGI